MKHQILDLLSYLIFIGSFSYVYGIGGAVETNTLEIGQAIKRLVVAFIIMAIAVCAINLKRNEEYL